MKKQLIFRGCATALITPMKDGEIDYTSLDMIIEKQIGGGVSALVVGGTTGEAATLTDGERYELYTHVKEKLGGRVKLILGTGTNDTRMAVRHTKIASYIGCDGILVVTPYYNKGTHSGVLEHYKRIAEASDIPMILYNVPSRTGVNLAMEQLEELAKLDTVVGLKEASDSTDRLVELSKFDEKLALYSGNDSQIFPTLALGGAGVISVASNLYPEYISKICNDCFCGEYESARTEQLNMLGFIKAIFKETNPAPIKYAMSLLGFCTPELRLPLLIPENDTQRELEAALKCFKM